MDAPDKNPVKGTKLYALLAEKTKDSAFLAAVEQLCKDGEALSTQNYCNFPTYTRHDVSHILGVCDWMTRLLDGMAGDEPATDTLTAEETALLLLAAFWHDSGMAVSATQKESLLADMDTRGGDWAAYFERHPKDAVDLAEARENTVERVLRNYVREHHAARCQEQLPAEADWSRALKDHHIYRKTVAAVCASHGEWMEDLNLPNRDRNFDLRLCAVLLRLADLLDYDESRAPEALFRFLDLDHPKTAEEEVSRDEWNKNAAGRFEGIEGRTIHYHSTFTDPQTEHGVRDYLDWVRRELDACQNYLAESELDRWRHFRLPHRVENNSEREGYDGGDFHITMDQDRVVELLTGNNLYEDAGVFVRELLQNAIDAVLERRKQDMSFGAEDGHIVVRCWQDNEGYGWFRIEDDGTGMNEHIIKDYFLKVGRSYYDSDEYRAASLHPARETGDKPTSRFGIGILSAFMTDPEHTTLEVLTRRYDEAEPLRLDVTGLHGYYSLTRVTRERPGLPMHTPNGLQHDNKRGVGTTVCVRVNRYRLGYGSFKELLDKYNVFPEVRVTYYDEKTSEGYDYPTQQELMDVVHELAGTEHVYPLTDEQFARVQSETSEWLHWTERPAFSMTLHPMDTLTEDISGVAVEAIFRGNAEYHEYISHNLPTYATKVELHSSIDRAKRQVSLEVTVYHDNLNYNHATEFSFDEFLPRLSDKERCIVSYVLNATKASEQSRTVTAFNGAAADRRDLAGYLGHHNICFVILLLRGDSRPTVNLSRNAITELPLDTFFALEVLYHDLPHFSLFHFESYPLNQFELCSERELCDVLKRHPTWATRLHCDELRLSKIEAESRDASILDVSTFGLLSAAGHLLIAALRRRFRLTADSDHLYLHALSQPLEPSELPVYLFVGREQAGSNLCEIVTPLAGVHLALWYDDHPFSLWFLAQQDVLREKTPLLYNSILKTMVLDLDMDSIRRELNDILDRLRSFDGNPFQVPADLRLTESDFT